MRNLKKILALVLALVMSLSLMATAGASQFPDVDESNPYATAIDVLDELKVFQGFDDGTFKPTETLNRAQAAVLVYRIATGDVENKYLDNYTFMQQSKFTDLDGYNWAKGYINYCQNAGIVVGTSATTFDPGAKVTGYQLLVMLLRTLGYGKAGEFADPKGWELKTATIAESEGITKNVTSGDFGAPAPRQMVAEILFRGLLTETVEYSALVPGGYTKSGETLGMREFGLEKVSGVVMANEWANLEGSKVVAADTTVMKVDGKNITVTKGTELDAVGLTYNAYIANGEGSTKRALTLEAGDNTVAFNEGKATGPDTDYSENREWASIQKLADTESISIKDSTEFFVNYDQAWNEDVTSDYRISYAIAQKSIPSAADNEWNKYIATLNADDGKNESDKTYPGHSISERTIKVNWDVNGDDTVDANDVVKCWYIAIRPDYLINEIDQDIMEEIFYSADRLGDNTDGTNTILQNYAIGEVYVGTTSMKDYSDTMSWKSFKTEYFNDTKTSHRFTSAENGESLRVIDNNNDGTAEYVLKIKYTMDQVTGTYKDAPELNGFRVAAKYKDNNLSMDGEFVAGDVVVYTVIDDKLTMWPAEVLTDSIKTKTFKNITVTTEGGEVKGQSGIENLTGMDQLIMNMNDKTQYNMYLDRFGFVRAYALAQGSKYALLTEMYLTGNQNWNYVQTGRVTAEMKMGEADIDEFNVTNRSGGEFFSGYAWTSRAGRYYNSDLNYLQPAIAHLGLADQYKGETKNTLSGADAGTAYSLSGWDRTVWAMKADSNYPAKVSNEFGVFNYGPESTANSSFSFTNVASYILDEDNNVTLGTAAKLAINQDGEQIYYDHFDTNWAKKTTQSEYVADAVKNGMTETQARKFFQDLVKGTNNSGENDNNVIRFYPVYAEDYVQLNREDVKAGTRHFTIPADYTTNFNASNNGYVDATVNTEFYIVMPNSIIYKVGYDELPTIKAEKIRAAYAVAKNTTAADNGRDYWVADVIVIEVRDLEYAYDSISLMYSNPFETSSSVRWIDSLNNKWKVYQPDSDKLAEMQVIPSDVINNDPNTGWGNHAWYGDDYGFYGLKQAELQEEGELTAKIVELITKDYNKYGIYAGTVQRIKGILNSSGYIDIDRSGRAYDGSLTTYENVSHVTARDVPVYRVHSNSVGTLTLSENDAYNEVELGDQVIVVCEQGSVPGNVQNIEKVAFIVDLATDADDKYTADPWLWDEYDAIIREQNAGEAPKTRVITFTRDGAKPLSAVDATDDNAITDIFSEIRVAAKSEDLAKETSVMKKTSDGKGYTIEVVEAPYYFYSFTLNPGWAADGAVQFESEGATFGVVSSSPVIIPNSGNVDAVIRIDVVNSSVEFDEGNVYTSQLDAAKAAAKKLVSDYIAKVAEENGLEAADLNDAKSTAERAIDDVTLSTNSEEALTTAKQAIDALISMKDGKYTGTQVTAIDEAVEELLNTLPEAVDGTITLESDVTLSEAIDLTDVTAIDLNGNTITVTADAISGNAAITLSENKALTITGPGMISTKGVEDKYVVQVTGTAKLTVGEGVVLESNGLDEAVIATGQASATGVEIVVNGELRGGTGIVTGGLSTNSKVTINKGAKIVATDWAIYAPGKSQQITINSGEIYGAMGGIEISGGNVDIRGGTISYGADDSYQEGVPYPDGGTASMYAAVSLTPYAGSAWNTSVNIGSGATLNGEYLLGFCLRDELSAYTDQTVNVTYAQSVVGNSVTFLGNQSDWTIGEPNSIGQVTISLNTEDNSGD